MLKQWCQAESIARQNAQAELLEAGDPRQTRLKLLKLLELLQLLQLLELLELL